jgi:hypothetical protein
MRGKERSSAIAGVGKGGEDCSKSASLARVAGRAGSEEGKACALMPARTVRERYVGGVSAGWRGIGWDEMDRQ